MISLLTASCISTTGKSEESKTTLENVAEDTLNVENDKEYMGTKLNPIRKYVNSIDSIKEWSLVVKKDTYLSIEGGEATFYNWNGKLKKVDAVDYGETYQKQAKYYLKNDTLIFVYEKVIKYNRPIYHDSISMKELGDNEIFDFDESLIFEAESYFENGKLIRLLDNQDCGAPFNKEYRNKEQRRIFMEFKALNDVYKGK